jgi:hypothetical protein
MPKSKVRKKTDYTINTANRTPVKVKAGPSGLVYQILHWMANLGPWNFLIGFALMVVGLLMTMRWR